MKTPRNTFVILSAFLSASAPTLANAQSFVQKMNSAYHSVIQTREVSHDQMSLGGVLACEQREMEVLGSDPVNGQSRVVRYKIYALQVPNFPAVIPRPPADRPTVVIVPPISGTNQIDTSYASAFCLAGLRVALLESWEQQNQIDLSLDSHDQISLRALSAIGNVIDSLVATGGPLRPAQLGLLGTSAGAITGALATGLDPRIHAANLIVGGGNLADIIATSDLDSFAQLRTARMKAFGFTSISQYRDALRAHIHIDPLGFASLSGPKIVSMTIATRDSTVPTIDQELLYRAFGSQERHDFALGHVPTVVQSALTDSADITGFFLRNLN